MKKLVFGLMAALCILSLGMAAFAEEKAPVAAEPAKEAVVKEEKAAAPAKDAAAAPAEKTPEKAPEAPAAEKK